MRRTRAETASSCCFQGFYDRGKELNWKNMKDLQFVGAMGPPGGARNNLDPRFVSLFDTFEVQFPSTTNLQTIYTSILAHHVASLSDEIKGQFTLLLIGKTSLGNVWLACPTSKYTATRL